LDAVIDKDYSAAKMGRIIRAQELWIITDVDGVYEDFGSSDQSRISSMTKKEAEKLHDEGLFQKGSIAPKIRAAIHFLKHHGDKVIITSIPHIEDALNGSAGTEIRNEA
jgi:carbamate kinase